MVVDICTYNVEKDLWDLHYNALKDHVDQFIVIAFDKTFSGQQREVTIPNPYLYPKTKVYVHDENVYGKYLELAESSPNTQGATHWKREFMQKESLKDALETYPKDTVVYVGDVDEIWHPKTLTMPGPLKLKLKVYTYYLNNRSSEQFWGTVKTTNEVIQNTCLNHLRVNAPRSKEYLGWHFTSMGGASEVHKKLTDSYTQESYATPGVLENLAYNIENGRDFLGRDFQYTVDESGWPQYLKDNRARYNHLCR